MNIIAFISKFNKNLKKIIGFPNKISQWGKLSSLSETGDMPSLSLPPPPPPPFGEWIVTKKS